MHTSTRPAPAQLRLRLAPRWPLVLLASLVLLAAAAGAALGYFMRFDMPDVQALEDYEPPEMTHVFAADGTLVGTFHEQRRILVDYEDVPEVFRQALLASEDASFYRHTGLDFRGIMRAAWRDLRSLRAAEGASTLTQQLARNLFLNPQKTLRRKAEEAVLALEIERQYTKQEILRFYCNQIYTGHGRYGVEAASRFYFGVPAIEMSLNQAATLAGVIQRPESLSPIRHPERALARRDYVLRRMVETGALTAEQAEFERGQPLQLAESHGRGEVAPYFVEEVRRWLQSSYGDDSPYTAGFEVRSTLDPALQEIAERAVEHGLRQLDKRQGWRGVAGHVAEGEDPDEWQSPDWSGGIASGEIYDAVVVALDSNTARLRVGPHRGTLGADEIGWTGRKSPAKLMQPGDVVRVRLRSFDDDGQARLELEQEPEVEAAFIALDPRSGGVRALVGGRDFGASEFDRATQARRQTGSAFKPFVYAAALSAGLTLADTLLDEPTVFLDPRNPVPYAPENYSNEYYGTITLRTALERSANIATVKLLDRIGYDAVISTAHSLGIRSELKPYPSLALGAFETTLLELTAAYGAFSNGGVWVQPHLIEEVREDDGRVLQRTEPDVREAVGPEIAYLMNRLLAGVITDGTGRSAASLNLPLAGKTGTTDDNTDAWFIGYAPGLAVGVWVGFDERRSLGKRETGAQAALPIWREFMKNAAPDEDRPQPPDGVRLVAIDRRSGMRANPRAYCNPVITEAFLAGTEPTETCSVYEHQRLRLPYPFQRYALDENGSLVVPVTDLEALLREETAVRLAEGGRRLEAYLPGEVVSIGLHIVGDLDANPAAARDLLAPFDVSSWVGKDGRPAQVMWIDGRPTLRSSR